MKSKNVLIVDDDPVSLKRLSSDLKGLGANVFIANNPVEGLSLFTENYSMDVVITDLQMPMGGGIEFIKDIRKMNLKIPIIVVSGTVDAKTFGFVKNLNCFDILVKPYNVKRLKYILVSIFE